MATTYTATGPEFLVNTQTANTQINPTVTGLSNGGFVVTWTDYSGVGVDISGSGIKAQIYNADGSTAGGEFLVNTTTASDQFSSTVTGLSNGGFVVTWSDLSGVGGDKSGSGIKAQVFNATGGTVGDEFLVNTATANDQLNSTVTGLSNGGFVVTWQDNSRSGTDTSGYGIKAQLYGADGKAVGTEFLVNTETANSQSSPTVTGLSNGGFVVTWTDYSQTGTDTSGYGVKAQIYKADGSTAGGEFLVNTATANDQSSSTVTGLANGGFVVTWLDNSGVGGDSDGFGIKAQIYNADGSRAGSEFLVNTTTASDQFSSTVTGLKDGGFVVTWTDNSGFEGPSGYDVKAQVYNADGSRAGSEFLVNTATASDQYQSTVSSLSDGGFVVTWQDESGAIDQNENYDPSRGSEIKAQRYSAAPTFDPNNPAPVLDAGNTVQKLVVERANVTGVSTADTANFTLAFTDASVGDTHTVSVGTASLGGTGYAGLSSDQKLTLASAVAGALTPGTVVESSAGSAGSVPLDFSVVDKTFDFLAAGETLTLSYVVSVADQNGGSSQQTVTVRVTGTNDLPVLAADTAGPHTLTEQPGTTNGIVIASGNAAPADTVTANLTFTDADLTDTHVVSIAAPTLSGTGYTLLSAGQQATLASALANALGNTLSDSTGTGSGSIALSFSAADATFDVLREGETLVVTYNVSVTDSQRVVSTQAVTFTITGSNDAAVIGTPMVAAVTEDSPSTTTTTLTATGTLSVTDADHDQSSFQTTVIPATGVLGTLTLAANGAYTYSVANSAVQYLAAGQPKNEVFTVTSLDGTTKDITFTITGTNDAPMLAADAGTHIFTEAAATTGSTTAVTLTASLSFTDVDLIDTHTVSVAAPVLTGSGTTGLTGDQSAALVTALTGALTPGTITDTSATVTTGTIPLNFSKADGAFDFLAAGEKLTISYDVTVSDQHTGGTATRPVVITVTGTNDAPVLAADTGTHAFAEQSGTTNGVVTATNTPATSATDSLSASLTFTDVDLSDTHTVMVSAPTLTGAYSNLSPAQQATLSAALASALTVPMSGITDSTKTGTGTIPLTFSAADAAFDVLRGGETLSVSYDVSVNDKNGGTSTQTVTFTITGSNDAAVIGTPMIAAVTEDSPSTTTTTLTASGTLSVTDADHNESSFLTTVTPATGVLGTLTLAANGAYTYSVANSAVQYLAAGQLKNEVFTVASLDGTTKDITFTITGTNDAPML
ncbi:beta strand repeat-containing protein, partial [Methylobacterium cerastii]|uniref:beta strand repeat-containing protein n=1 Tax=Methylobacterium cerastii TaxID=932741 RepID=UPI001EE2BC2B